MPPPDARPSWLHVVSGHGDAVHPGPAGHRRTVTVRGSRCRTRSGLFSEWAAALRVPDYFGHNWDGFAECLADTVRPTGRDPVPDGPLTILVRDAEELLADEPPRALGILLAVVDDLVATAAGAPPAILLLLVCPAGRLATLRRRVGDAYSHRPRAAE